MFPKLKTLTKKQWSLIGGIFAVCVVALMFCAFSIEKNIDITVNPRTAQGQAQTQSVTVPLAATVGQIPRNRASKPTIPPR